MQGKLRRRLSTIKLVPAGIEDFKRGLYLMYVRSRVAAKEPVGTRAAEAISAPVTQMALNSFHSSGSSKSVTGGIDAMRELLNAQKKRKNPSMSIHFRNKKLTYEEVYRKRGDFINVTMDDLLEDYELEVPQNLSHDWWEEAYSALTGKHIPQASWVLRVKLKVDVMYSYKVTMEDVARAIETDTPPSVVCICSPLNIGTIDIYPVEAAIGEAVSKGVNIPIPSDQLSLTFLNLIVLPNLANISIKGIKGVKAFFPVKVPVWQVVREEVRAYSDEQIAASGLPEETQSLMRRAWCLVYNTFRMVATGLSVENLINLCTEVGMVVQQQTDDYLVIIMPKEDTKPGKYVQELIANEEKIRTNSIKERKEAGEAHPYYPPTALDRVSNYVYADTNGTNLQEVLAMEDIDTVHTISNDFHEVAAVIGIRAARNLMIKELIDVIAGGGSYINPRHVVLLVDFMTGRGEILSITFSGISRQPVGALAKVSFERTLETLAAAAAAGGRQEVESTTASILIGKRMKMGTGGIDVKLDQPAYQKYLDELRTNDDDISVDDLRGALGEVKVKTAEDEPDLDEMFGPGPASVVAAPTRIASTIPVTINKVPVETPVLIQPAPLLPTQLTEVVDELQVVPSVPVAPPAPPKITGLFNFPKKTIPAPSKVPVSISLAPVSLADIEAVEAPIGKVRTEAIDPQAFLS